MSQLHPHYQSYLLRLWRPDSRTGWRIVVENVNSGERRSFSDLGRLHAFLEARQQDDHPGGGSMRIADLAQALGTCSSLAGSLDDNGPERKMDAQ
jgi:hypothetical protein